MRHARTPFSASTLPQPWLCFLRSTAYILPEDLPKEIRPPSDLADSGKGLYEREFAAFQKSLFERILRETRGNRAEAARRLGWHQNSFRRRCSELSLE